MNFKRVLVFVMALALLVSACASSVLAALKPESKHEHLEEALNNPELEEKYEEIKATVEYVAKDIEENHEEYYANGYAYALENGYIDTAIDVIKATLETLPQIDLEEVGMTEELREKLETELDALPGTLEKLLEILESDEVSEYDGFVEAVLTLEGDLYLHMNNIYAILEQGSIDLNQLVLVPAFNEAMRLLEEEVIPAVEATVDAVIDYVVEMLTPYYEKAVEILGVARDTYEALVETLVKLNVYVGELTDKLVDAYNTVLGTILNVYGTVENTIDAINNSIKAACDLYNKIVDAVVDFNAKVENTIDKVEKFVVKVTEAYKRTVELIVEIYGHVKNAVIVAGQIFDFIVENRPLIEEGVENAVDFASRVFDDVVEILEAAYENKDDAEYVAMKVLEYVVEVLNAINDELNDLHNGAFVGKYELTDDSYYVAIGNAPYAEGVATKLNLKSKYSVTTFGGNYIAELAKADLVTVKFDNGSFMTLAEKQVEGKIAEIIRNSDLYPWYNAIPNLINKINGNFFIPADLKATMTEGLTYVKDSIDEKVDLSAEVVELDWDKYLDAEGKEALAELLAKVRVEALKQGVPEYYYIDLNPYIAKAGVGDLVHLDPVEVPAADLVVFAVENMIYGYAEFVGNINSVLANAPANATIILTPVSNPLYGYSFKGIDFSAYAESADTVVDLLNAHLYGFAVANENVVFVNSEDADDIYNALEVYCDHVCGGCTDTVCDRCLGKITPPGHSFTNYVSNEDATCKKDGTETAKCDYCDATNKRTVKDSKLPHTWEPATCVSPMRCSVCKTKEGGLADHVLGEWRVIKDPTSNSEGAREKKCLTKGCEYRIVESIPYKNLSTIATVGIIVACVAGAGCLSACVAGFFRKRNKI